MIYTVLVIIAFNIGISTVTHASYTPKQIIRARYVIPGAFFGALLGPLGLFVGGVTLDMMYQSSQNKNKNKNKHKHVLMNKSNMMSYAPFNEKKEATIFFKIANHTLTENEKLMLRNIAMLLKKEVTFTVDILGSTDPTGKKNNYNNQSLSKRRADVVADYLITMGVDKNRLSVQGVGAIETSNAEDYPNIRITKLKLMTQ